MATRTISVAGGDFNAVGTWDEGIAPVAGDAVVARGDGTSGNLTVNVASGGVGLLSFIITNYVGTLAMNATLTVSGTVTLVAGMTITGTSDLICNTTATLTSGGKTLTGGLQLKGTSQTYTLADNWDIDGTLVFSGTTAVNLTGAFNINVAGGLTMTTTSSGAVTTTIILDGTGTWSGNIALRNNLTINTAGTITISGSVAYNTGTLTYTAGTTTTTGSILAIAATSTINTNGITWNNVTMTGTSTMTLTSDMTLTGLLTIGASTLSTTVNGGTIYTAGGYTVGGTTGNNLGTSRIVMNGTGTLQMSAKTTGTNRLEILIDAGTSTVTIGTLAQLTNPIIYKSGILAGNILGFPKTRATIN